MGWKKETVFKLNPRVKRPQGLRRFHNQKAHPSHTPLFCEYRMCRVANVINGIPVDRLVSSSEEAIVTGDIDPENELVVNVQALASSLEGAQEKTVTNYATVSATAIDETQTNSITHIIEPNEEFRTALPSEDVDNTTANEATQSNIDKTYKITGTAWIDSNENGTRDEGEELFYLSISLCPPDS